jgi:hypothetical protein
LELGELYDQQPHDELHTLLYQNVIIKKTLSGNIKEEISRKYVIEQMFRECYGVNIDLQVSGYD